jgi:hypothetical protein
MSERIYALGQANNSIAVPRTLSMGGPGGSQVFYTKPDLSVNFSRFGFAYPLDDEGVPYEVLMLGGLPRLGPHVKRSDQPRHFLLIDHNGLLWKVLLALIDDEWTHFTTYIDPNTEGWWMITGPGEFGLNTYYHKLAGFLYTDPPREVLEAFVFEHDAGRKLRWLEVEKITEALNEHFPL